MEEIYNKKKKEEILSKLNAIIDYLKVDYLLCKSNYIDSNNISYSKLEKKFEKDKKAGHSANFKQFLIKNYTKGTVAPFIVKMITCCVCPG